MLWCNAKLRHGQKNLHHSCEEGLFVSMTPHTHVHRHTKPGAGESGLFWCSFGAQLVLETVDWQWPSANCRHTHARRARQTECQASQSASYKPALPQTVRAYTRGVTLGYPTVDSGFTWHSGALTTHTYLGLGKNNHNRKCPVKLQKKRWGNISSNI